MVRLSLVRAETSPEDIHGMHAAQGILTATGGMTPTQQSLRAGWAVHVWRVVKHLIDEEPGKVTILRGNDENILLSEGRCHHHRWCGGHGLRGHCSHGEGQPQATISTP